MAYLVITSHEEKPDIVYAHTNDTLVKHLLNEMHPLHTTVVEVADEWPHVLAGQVDSVEGE